MKVKQRRQTRVYLGFIRPKTGTMRFGPMAGLVGCAFDLILECTCFWPQTDHVYLFLATALHIALCIYDNCWALSCEKQSSPSSSLCLVRYRVASGMSSRKEPHWSTLPRRGVPFPAPPFLCLLFSPRYYSKYITPARLILVLCCMYDIQDSQ